VDANPVTSHLLASGGDDGRISLWDVRKPATPVLALPAEHGHWVYNVKYNPLHEQLLLSGGTDSRVVLWRLPSGSDICAGTEGPANGDGATTSPASPRSPQAFGRDGNSSVVQKYQQYEDSVYGVAWSSKNPWLFATLSYDGQMLLHLVPKAEKYKLLM